MINYFIQHSARPSQWLLWTLPFASTYLPLWNSFGGRSESDLRIYWENYFPQKIAQLKIIAAQFWSPRHRHRQLQISGDRCVTLLFLNGVSTADKLYIALSPSVPTRNGMTQYKMQLEFDIETGLPTARQFVVVLLIILPILPQLLLYVLGSEIEFCRNVDYRDFSEKGQKYSHEIFFHLLGF